MVPKIISIMLLGIPSIISAIAKAVRKKRAQKARIKTKAMAIKQTNAVLQSEIDRLKRDALIDDNPYD